MENSLWEILEQAGVAMWIIIAFSVLAVAVALERLAMQWRFLERARVLHDTVSRCVMRGALDEGRSACERSRSALADVYLVGYERLGRSKPEHLYNAVHRERVRVNGDLKKRLWILGTIGATAPFVGLFGTVVGIMDAFAEIHAKGEAGLDVVAGPISEALWATAAGIAVGVEAVIIYNWLNQRSNRIAVELRMLTDEFLEHLDVHGTGQDPTAKVPEEPGKSESREGEEKRNVARDAA